MLPASQLFIANVIHVDRRVLYYERLVTICSLNLSLEIGDQDWKIDFKNRDISTLCHLAFLLYFVSTENNNNLLTPRSTVLLEKLTSFRSYPKKFPAFLWNPKVL
jgi:hypothetical protein